MSVCGMYIVVSYKGLIFLSRVKRPFLTVSPADRRLSQTVPFFSLYLWCPSGKASYRSPLLYFHGITQHKKGRDGGGGLSMDEDICFPLLQNTSFANPVYIRLFPFLPLLTVFSFSFNF
jgi:hypothetical protein